MGKSMFRTFVAVSLLVLLNATTFQPGVQTGAATPDTKSRVQSNDRKIAHVLTRLTFGAKPGDFEQVKAIGIEKFVAQQLDFETVPDTTLADRLRKLPTLSLSTPDLIEQYTPPKPSPSPSPSPASSPNMSPMDQNPVAMPLAGQVVAQNPGMQETKPEVKKEPQPAAKPPVKNQQLIVTELQRAALLRAVYSERQLFEVMVKFWENHFRVFASKDADRFFMTEFDRDAIRPFALGNFRDLLGATARSSAMLFYLDNWQSGVPRQYPATKDRPARTSGGINENYARELMELHTLGVDGGYTQKDVQEVARCFTGGTIFQPRGGGAAVNGMMGHEAARRTAGTFFFNARAHDDGEKTVLGQNIPEGGGFKDGLKVLDILAHHPATAKFIATKLVRHFVSDTPPPALVDRVAAAFTKSDGDIRETLKAIFFANEFNSPEAYRAKIKRPFELVVSAIRTLGADTNGGPATHQWIARMGEPLYGFQTPNGYSDAAESWVNTGGLLERMNFGLALAGNRIQGTRVDLAKLNAPEKSKLIDGSLKMIVAGDISAATRETLLKQIDETNADTSAKVVGLILGTPEFQRQ